MDSFLERGTWINKENLLPFIELLFFILHEKLSEDDIDEIKRGLTGTNDEENRWSEHLFGKGKIVIKIAEDPGTDIYHMRLKYSEELSEKVNIVLHVVDNYSLLKQS